MSLRTFCFKAVFVLSVLLLLIGGAAAQEPITLQFYYPVGVAGPLAQAIDGYVAEFNALNEDIQVEPIFTGNYVENMARAASRDSLSASRPMSPSCYPPICTRWWIWKA